VAPYYTAGGVGEGFPFKPPTSPAVGLGPDLLYTDDHMDSVLWLFSVLATSSLSKRVVSISSQLTTQLLDHPDPSSPPRVLHRPGRRISDASILLIPIFWGEGGTVGHWAVVRVRMDAATITLADSMSAVSPSPGRDILTRLPPILNGLLARDGLPARVWSTSMAPRATQQRRGSVDCGPLSCGALFPLLWGMQWTPAAAVEELRASIALWLFAAAFAHLPRLPRSV
jgi:hypothetical protein